MSTHWSGARERGTVPLLRIMRWIALTLGWRSGRILLYPITAWFLAASPGARRSSREFLARALERPVGAWDVARHFFNFASVILDRVFLLTGRTARFAIETEGLEHVVRLAEARRGCILMGAHLGSFEALRSLARQSPVQVRPMMYRRNAGALTRLLEQLDPQMRERVIEIGGPDGVLRARDSLARGEIVAMLADRATAGQAMVPTMFLGGMAGFPAGPFLLAAGLGVPVVLFYGLRTGPRRYVIRFEPFADPLALPREGRAGPLQDCVGRFAASLEAQCRAHPLNWFNFYPFWELPSDVGTHASCAAAGGRGSRFRAVARTSPGAGDA